MTDYKEEQNNEIEALESIYPEEFEILETHPFHKFQIKVKSENYNEEEEDGGGGACICLLFEYTRKYPDEPPVMEILPVENIEEDNLEDLRTELLAQCEENMGMVMVFTLVSHSLEWLNTYLETIEREHREEEERKKWEEEEAERKKFEGTRVTVETFMVWKKKFDFQMYGTIEQDKETERTKKLTGKELFMRDKTLNESDLNFLGDGEAEVAVDESLFQDLDDLDLEDDEDEDFIPGEDSD